MTSTSASPTPIQANGVADSASGDRPIHVVHVIGQLARGGAELQLARLLSRINRPPWRHSVIQFWDGGDEEILHMVDRDASRFAMHKRKGFDPRFVLRFMRTLRELKPDIVHTWLASAALWGRLLVRRAVGRVPVVTSMRGLDVHGVPGEIIMDRWLARRTQRFIFNGKQLQEFWAARLKLSVDEMVTIPNGVDATKYRPSSKTGGMRESLGCPPNSVLIAMVGSLYPVKNWPMFLDVAARVRDAKRNALFLGVGGGQLLEPMRRRADVMGLSSTVHFLGRRTDVAEILGVSDIALLTSNSEGMPNAVLESMACGLPVVSTRVSGSEELVEPGANGFLVPVGDTAAAAEHVIELCDDSDLRTRMGTESRRRTGKYTFDAMAEGHESVYRRALAQRNGISAK
jgi:glycosyltransferase involved in cell wall biosynthesis